MVVFSRLMTIAACVASSGWAITRITSKGVKDGGKEPPKTVDDENVDVDDENVDRLRLAVQQQIPASATLDEKVEIKKINGEEVDLRGDKRKAEAKEKKNVENKNVDDKVKSEKKAVDAASSSLQQKIVAQDDPVKKAVLVKMADALKKAGTNQEKASLWINSEDPDIKETREGLPEGTQNDLKTIAASASAGSAEPTFNVVKLSKICETLVSFDDIGEEKVKAFFDAAAEAAKEEKKEEKKKTEDGEANSSLELKASETEDQKKKKTIADCNAESEKKIDEAFKLLCKECADKLKKDDAEPKDIGTDFGKKVVYTWKGAFCDVKECKSTKLYEEKCSSPMSTACMVGIIVGCVVGVILLAVIVFVLMSKKKAAAADGSDDEDMEDEDE